ncbi:hypothetical protein ACIRRH_26450 [Kitasatospora sp. NPDC101235]|uniref:hypothetical protein n=1 Tax=Kitasatospora sp. NPDC101235 TaxID=3364101 RepID=UPI0038169ACD
MTHADDELARLWEAYRKAPFPDALRRTRLAGKDAALLDFEIAGLVWVDIHKELDGRQVAALRESLAVVDEALPLIEDEYGASYFTDLRTMAAMVAERHPPGQAS